MRLSLMRNRDLHGDTCQQTWDASNQHVNWLMTSLLYICIWSWTVTDLKLQRTWVSTYHYTGIYDYNNPNK